MLQSMGWRRLGHDFVTEQQQQEARTSLLYSTANYIQNLVITYNGKESEREHYTHTHTHIKLNHFAVHLKLTQHCKSNTSIKNV